MASEIIEYRGYELHIEPYESGFKVRIRKSGSLFDRPELPYSENKTQREQMIAEFEGYRRHGLVSVASVRFGCGYRSNSGNCQISAAYFPYASQC